MRRPSAATGTFTKAMVGVTGKIADTSVTAPLNGTKGMIRATNPSGIIPIPNGAIRAMSMHIRITVAGEGIMTGGARLPVLMKGVRTTPCTGVRSQGTTAVMNVMTGILPRDTTGTEDSGGTTTITCMATITHRTCIHPKRISHPRRRSSRMHCSNNHTHPSNITLPGIRSHPCLFRMCNARVCPPLCMT